MTLFGEVHFDWTKLFLGPIAGATVTAIVTLIIWWFNRKKPSIVECRELESFSLLRISPSVRKRIDVQFDGDKIAALSQSQIEVVNRGAETVDDVNILFEFPKQEFWRSLSHQTSVKLREIPTYLSRLRSHI